MGFIDNLLGRKSTPAANPTQLLPLQTTMRTRGYLTGIGGQDLYAYLSRRLPGSLKDWTAVTGDLLLNSIVAISMDYYIRGFSQAVPMVFQLSDKDDEYEKIPDHPMLALLANPQYGLAPTRFWSNLIIDYKLYGNCYIRKIRSSTRGSVIGLQYLPAQSMQPFGDGTTALTKWRYVNDGIPYAHNGPLAAAAQPQMSLIHQKLNPMFFFRDGIIVRYTNHTKRRNLQFNTTQLLFIRL